MKAFLAFLSFISLFSLLTCICTPGVNCPHGRGICQSNNCICFERYWTVVDPKTPANDQVYCSYTRLSRFAPLFLESFLPTIGHLYSGRTDLFLLKLSFILVPIILLCFNCYCKCTESCTSCFMCLLVLGFICFGLMHVVDIICYATAIYVDGNGAPLL